MTAERVSIHFQDQRWLAISVAISEANDVYVNYLGDTKKRHTSRHASGQHHQKIGRHYVAWTGGPSRCLEPMKEFKPRPMDVLHRDSIAVWGWTIARLSSVLPSCPDICEMVVDVTAFPTSWEIGLEVSVVNGDRDQRTEILGFPVVQRHRISNGIIVVEIEAFVVDPSTDNY